MSNTMTRDEAREWLEDALEAALSGEGSWGKHQKYQQALSILAPSPNCQPPTKEEVGDGELCWVAIAHDPMTYELAEGKSVRRLWNEHPKSIAWLYYNALPDLSALPEVKG